MHHRQPQVAGYVVAIYRMEVKIISRGKGHSSVAAAAYRAGDKLHDARDKRTHDYTPRRGKEAVPSIAAAAAYRSGSKVQNNKQNVAHDYTDKHAIVHSEIMAPDGAPGWALDRERLWNKVEAREDRSTKRDTAQLARELLLTLPRELDHSQRIDLVRRYMSENYVSKGMIADINLHNPPASDGGENPHAHVLLTMRPIVRDDFGNKARNWNPEFWGGQWVTDEGKNKLISQRTDWETYVNQALEEAGSSARVDSRSYEARGMKNMEPQQKMGKGHHMANRAPERYPEAAARQALNERTRWMNQQRLHFARASRYIDPAEEIEQAARRAREFYRTWETPEPDGGIQHDGRVHDPPERDIDR